MSPFTLYPATLFVGHVAHNLAFCIKFAMVSQTEKLYKLNLRKKPITAHCIVADWTMEFQTPPGWCWCGTLLQSLMLPTVAAGSSIP